MDDAQSGPLVADAGARAPGGALTWKYEEERRPGARLIAWLGGQPIAAIWQSSSSEVRFESWLIGIEDFIHNARSATRLYRALDLASAKFALEAAVRTWMERAGLMPLPSPPGTRAKAVPRQNPTARHIIPDPPR